MHKVPDNVINAILSYLNTQPYGQVAAMINALSKCENIPEDEPEK